MRGVVIQDDADFDLGCIKTVKRFEKINKFGTSVPVLNISMDMAGEEVDGGQKRNGAMPFMFRVARQRWILARNRWKIWGHILNRLDARFFIERKHSGIKTFSRGPHHFYFFVG